MTDLAWVGGAPRTHSTWIQRAVLAVPLLIAAFYCVGFLVAGYFRVTFAYPMGTSESESAQAVRQIAEGKPLYGPPTLGFVSPIYAPLYFYVAALLGGGLTSLRLVSLLASIGSALLIGWLVWREARQLLPAIGAAALFIASTQLGSTALDLARTDALCVFWLIAALACARSADTSGHALWLSAASGALTALAILTKQTAALVALALVADALFGGSRMRAVAYSALLLVALGLALLALSSASGDWPWVYLAELPRRHAIDASFITSFWTTDLLPAFLLPLVLGVIYLVNLARRGDRDGLRFWALTPLAMIGLAWVSRVNVAASQNVLLPAFAALALWFGLGIAELQALVPFRAVGPLLIAAQLLVLQYNPRLTSPLRSDVWAGERLVQTISGLPGTVYGPLYAEYVYQAGKGDDAMAVNLMELMGPFGGGMSPQGAAWMADYNRALRERRFDWLLLDEFYAGFLRQAAEDNGYVDTGQLFPADDEFTHWQSPYTQNPHVWVPAERVSR
jgi:4-amino-4-deoxy-L-arabinose transferase-like glycosyltransferase